MSAEAHAALSAPLTTAAPAIAAPRRSPVPRPTFGRPQRSRPLGDPTPLVCTVARTALEVALGGDGIEQLTRWITPDVRRNLLAQRSLARRAAYRVKGASHVQRVRLCRVSPEAVEAAVVVSEGEVVHALAMRLEAVAGRWSVTVLDVG